LEASSWAFHDADAFEEATLGIDIQAEDADTTGDLRIIGLVQKVEQVA
jgi:hypothetical protein